MELSKNDKTKVTEMGYDLEKLIEIKKAKCEEAVFAWVRKVIPLATWNDAKHCSRIFLEEFEKIVDEDYSAITEGFGEEFGWSYALPYAYSILDMDDDLAKWIDDEQESIRECNEENLGE